MSNHDGRLVNSDVFVFFGAPVDLAHKKIFPAVYRLVHRGVVDDSVIGVARAGWDPARLRQHARTRWCRHLVGSTTRLRLDRLLSLLGYVDGDYTGSAMFEALRTVLSEAGRLLPYLAIHRRCSPARSGSYARCPRTGQDLAGRCRLELLTNTARRRPAQIDTVQGPTEGLRNGT